MHYKMDCITLSLQRKALAVVATMSTCWRKSPMNDLALGEGADAGGLLTPEQLDREICQHATKWCDSFKHSPAKT
jgi:hypothetical protein